MSDDMQATLSLSVHLGQWTFTATGPVAEVSAAFERFARQVDTVLTNERDLKAGALQMAALAQARSETH